MSHQEEHALAFLHGPTATQETQHHYDGTHGNEEVNTSKQAAVYVEVL